MHFCKYCHIFNRNAACSASGTPGMQMQGNGLVPKGTVRFLSKGVICFVRTGRERRGSFLQSQSVRQQSGHAGGRQSDGAARTKCVIRRRCTRIWKVRGSRCGSGRSLQSGGPVHGARLPEKGGLSMSILKLIIKDLFDS